MKKNLFMFFVVLMFASCAQQVTKPYYYETVEVSKTDYNAEINKVKSTNFEYTKENVFKLYNAIKAKGNFVAAEYITREEGIDFLTPRCTSQNLNQIIYEIDVTPGNTIILFEHAYDSTKYVIMYIENKTI